MPSYSHHSIDQTYFNYDSSRKDEVSKDTEKLFKMKFATTDKTVIIFKSVKTALNLLEDVGGLIDICLFFIFIIQTLILDSYAKLHIVKGLFVAARWEPDETVTPHLLKVPCCSHFRHLYFWLSCPSMKDTKLARQRRLFNRGYAKVEKALDVKKILQLKRDLDTLMRLQFTKA